MVFLPYKLLLDLTTAFDEDLEDQLLSVSTAWNTHIVYISKEVWRDLVGAYPSLNKTGAEVCVCSWLLALLAIPLKCTAVSSPLREGGSMMVLDGLERLLPLEGSVDIIAVCCGSLLSLAMVEESPAVASCAAAMAMRGVDRARWLATRTRSTSSGTGTPSSDAGWWVSAWSCCQAVLLSGLDRHSVLPIVMARSEERKGEGESERETEDGRERSSATLPEWMSPIMEAVEGAISSVTAGGNIEVEARRFAVTVKNLPKVKCPPLPPWSTSGY